MSVMSVAGNDTGIMRDENLRKAEETVSSIRGNLRKGRSSRRNADPGGFKNA